MEIILVRELLAIVGKMGGTTSHQESLLLRSVAQRAQSLQDCWYNINSINFRFFFCFSARPLLLLDFGPLYE